MSVNDFHILLIDDDEDDYVNIRDLSQEIPRSKIKLIWKSTYSEGLAALQNQTFDACLLDYRLGERTGLDLLHESHKLGVNCPIIFLTGQNDFEIDIQAMQVGAADYLVKGQLTAPLLERSIRYSIKHALDMEDMSEKQQNFETLFNSTFEGIVVHKQGVIHDVNSGACQIFERDQHSIIGTSLLSLIRDDLRPEIEQEMLLSKLGKFETVGLKADGTEIQLEFSNRLVSLKGESFSLSAVRDLTERKRMEAQIIQQDRLASLGLLASSLAHEIGTPMGIIRSRAELAEKRTVGSDLLKNDMGIITTQIDRIAKLVNSLLYLARERKSDLSAPVDLAHVVRDVLSLVNHELERKNIVLETKLEPNLLVRAEPGPLGQVLLNFFVNAVHAIEEARQKEQLGSHQITLNAYSKTDSVEIVIRDTGCGIPEKNMIQLFKPFFTTKEIGFGTGLGLATSYKLVESWGGLISVESQVGRGTTFTIRLIKVGRI